VIQRAGPITMIQDGVVAHDRSVAIINRSNLGILAILTAIRRIWSLLSRFAVSR
jgi:hypothetical protein